VIGDGCWESLAPLGPQPSARAQHAGFMYNNKMYLYGGTDGTTLSDVWELSF